MKMIAAALTMAVTLTANAEQPITCNEWYETFIEMSAADRICQFDDDTREHIAEFKKVAAQNCRDSLSNAARSKINDIADKKTSAVVKKYGISGFCERVEKSIATSNEPAVEHIDEEYVLSKHQPENGIIKNSSMIYMLDPKLPCPYAFPNYQNMRSAFVFNPLLKNPAAGCWAVTDDPSRAGVIVFGKDGSVSSDLNLMSFYRVSVLDNGDGKVLGPVMTREQFQSNIAEYKKQFIQP